MDWGSRFARGQSVIFLEAIRKCLSLSSQVGNRLAVAILQGRDLSAEPGVSLQVTKELLQGGGSLLRQCVERCRLLVKHHLRSFGTLSTEHLAVAFDA